jgi:hypothetical protein
MIRKVTGLWWKGMTSKTAFMIFILVVLLGTIADARMPQKGDRVWISTAGAMFDGNITNMDNESICLYCTGKYAVLEYIMKVDTPMRNICIATNTITQVKWARLGEIIYSTDPVSERNRLMDEYHKKYPKGGPVEDGRKTFPERGVYDMDKFNAAVQRDMDKFNASLQHPPAEETKMVKPAIPIVLGKIPDTYEIPQKADHVWIETNEMSVFDGNITDIGNGLICLNITNQYETTTYRSNLNVSSPYDICLGSSTIRQIIWPAPGDAVYVNDPITEISRALDEYSKQYPNGGGPKICIFGDCQ